MCGRHEQGEATSPLQGSIVQSEEAVQRFWRRRSVPEASRVARQERVDTLHPFGYDLYQEPLVVAGQTWDEQARLLATADLVARYRAIRGSAVGWHSGWVCHGLQVEVAVERALGADVADTPHPSDYDLARFNAACRDFALMELDRGEALAARLGAWLDPDRTFVSLTPDAIATVWAALRKLWDMGSLQQVYRVAPVCPRCATPLSESEASPLGVAGSGAEGQRAEGRETASLALAVTGSVWVGLPWVGEPNTYLLVCLPDPWMAVGLVAVAAHPEANYVLVELAGGPDRVPIRLVLAEAALERVGDTAMMRPEFQIVRQMRGKALQNVRYHPPFTFLPTSEGTAQVVLSTEIPQGEGSGLMPLMPAFDAASLAVAQAHGLPAPQLLDEGGILDEAVMQWRGLSPLDAESLLVGELRGRGLVFYEEVTQQRRVLCPYCWTPLLPLAGDVWQVEMERGPWIIGRERPWGVPLPVWACEQCGERHCVAGLDELGHRTGLAVDEIATHRPGVDRISFPCDSCGGTMRRVQTVVDAAFEGAVLSLLWQTPSALAGQGRPPGRPAGSGGAQEDRQYRQGCAVGLDAEPDAWIHRMNELASLLWGERVTDQLVIVPQQVGGGGWRSDRGVPADAVRWAAYTGTTPDEAERALVAPLWQWLVEDAARVAPDESGDGLSEAWPRAHLYQTIHMVTGALNAGDVQQAAQGLAAALHVLADWHAQPQLGVRREVLASLCQLLAPFVPHLSDAFNRRLGRKVESVHLEDWPLLDPDWAQPALLRSMAEIWRLAKLGQLARETNCIAPERVLRQAVVGRIGADRLDILERDEFRSLLADLLHVGEVRPSPYTTAPVIWSLSLERGRFSGREGATAEIEAALQSLSPERAADLAANLISGLSVALEVERGALTLLPDEVRISGTPKAGWATATEGGLFVGLAVG